MEKPEKIHGKSTTAKRGGNPGFIWGKHTVGKPHKPVIFQWPRITVGDGDRAVSRRFDYSFLEPEIEGLGTRPRLVVEKLGISKHRGFPQKGIWNFGLMLHRISRCLTLSISCDCKIFCYADR